jgi:vacuolar-type H+-ATPase subunit H
MTITKILQEVEKAMPTDIERYRPKTLTETVEKTGDILGESITTMFRRLAEEVRTHAQEVVNEAIAAQKEADKFAADICATGEKHAQRLLKSAQEVKGFLELLSAQRSIFVRDNESQSQD